MKASNLLRLSPALVVLGAACAAVAPETSLRLTVLSAETRALTAESAVPKDCDFQNFSAYCNESKNPTSLSIMLVRDNQGKSYRISCTNDSRWSKCAPLPVGRSFDARQDKHGITVFYRNEKGKEKKETYQLVAALPANAPAAAAPAPVREDAAGNAPPAEAEPPVTVQHAVTGETRCSFRSTPSGADIVIDGKYSGNTPSDIGLRNGVHVVVLSMQGFAEWKRDLNVAPDSAVNVTARLQKIKP